MTHSGGADHSLPHLLGRCKDEESGAGTYVDAFILRAGAVAKTGFPKLTKQELVGILNVQVFLGETSAFNIVANDDRLLDELREIPRAVGALPNA